LPLTSLGLIEVSPNNTNDKIDHNSVETDFWGFTFSYKYYDENRWWNELNIKDDSVSNIQMVWRIYWSNEKYIRDNLEYCWKIWDEPAFCARVVGISSDKNGDEYRKYNWVKDLTNSNYYLQKSYNDKLEYDDKYSYYWWDQVYSFSNYYEVNKKETSCNGNYWCTIWTSRMSIVISDLWFFRNIRNKKATFWLK
jgi:hypothetical protein